MKTTLLILSVLFTTSVFAQIDNKEKWKQEKIDLRLSKYDEQVETGKAFFYAGLIGEGLSSLLLINNTKDNMQYAQSIGVIAGTFTIYGFFNLLDSPRHIKDAYTANLY